MKPNHKFVVVAQGTCHVVGSYCHFGTAQNKSTADDEILTREVYFARTDEEVEVTNCVTNLPAIISRGQVGTCCDPSMERYHCM